MSVKMTIELSDKGIFVEGPLESKPLCYAMLKGAEKVIDEYPKNKVNLGSNIGLPNSSSPMRSN